MTQGFFQFNNYIINETIKFASSSFDLLFMSGPRGASKSETIEKIVPLLKEQNLVFQHFCFENTVIDDFLLNFYDALRNFSLMQKISLKKFVTDNFKEKVNHYFKTIDADCIIVVENFEKVDNNIEIVDFLSHLASFKNVKIVIVTRNGESNLFRFKQIRTKTLTISEIDKDDFKSKLAILSEPLSLETKEKFYEITQGLELYLKMSVKYCTTANTTIDDLLDEYQRKSTASYITFEEFLVNKFISLVPAIYKSMLKMLSALSHPVSREFLKFYKLGNVNYIEYFSNNFLANFFKEEIYVKDYFRQYIVKSLSIQERVTYYKNFVKIYENELTKSPKDRLLRLSRESIRKEIERFNNLIPSINSASKNEKTFSYLGIQAQAWQDEKTIQKNKLTEKLNKIKERKNQLLNNPKNAFEVDKTSKEIEKEENEKTKRFIVELINSSREYTKKYQYNDAISELLRAQQVDIKEEFTIEISLLLAKNHQYLNEYKTVGQYYQKALELAKEKGDIRRCEIEFLIALMEKSLFKIDEAKEKFQAIVDNKFNSQNYVAKAYLELGEIEEANSQANKASQCYKNALELSLGKDKTMVCKAYYKLAILYDEQQDYERAVKYYQKNYTTSSERRENPYYSVCLTNLALIYSEQGNYKYACEYLKLALIYDGEINDWENMYFAQKELAKLYARFDEISAIGYYKQALDSAKKLKDVFKEALVHFETGEFYYDRQEDEKALVNFLNAKLILKNTADKENIARIDLRIKDIEMRISASSFRLIMEKYDK